MDDSRYENLQPGDLRETGEILQVAAYHEEKHAFETAMEWFERLADIEPQEVSLETHACMRT